MNCFECAKTNDAIAAVGICQHCGVGLCLDHSIEAHGYRVGGTLWLPSRDSRDKAAPGCSGWHCRRPPVITRLAASDGMAPSTLA